MSNRLLELEKSLGRAATAVRGKPRSRKVRPAPAKPVPPPTPAAKPAAPAPTAAPATPNAPAATVTAPAKQAAVARAASAVNYRVPGIVAPLKQPSGMTCWATVTTIMVMWKQQASMTIQTAIGRIGSNWLAKFNANQGLLGNEKATFLAAAGLTYQHPQSLTAGGWEGLMRRFGPIWVTTDEDPSANFAIHARVLVGIKGDGTAAGTTLDIVDPGTGTEYKENFDKFLEKYESEARVKHLPLRIQIVHWPADAGFSVSRSLAERESTYAFSLATQAFETVDQAEFEPAYDESKPDAQIAKARALFVVPFDKKKKLKATDIKWAADADSPDYRHLGTAIDTNPFALNGTCFGRLIQLNRFSLEGSDPKVIFGLRGCTLDSNQTTFVDSVSVREIVPNHIDHRCIIGVWDSATNKIVAFQASTVPNWEYMEAYRQDNADKANMLPCGKYNMVVGTHRPKKKGKDGKLADNPKRVQGALRNDQTVVVLRSEDDLSYTVADTWDKTVANDNIHASIIKTNTGTSTVPDYSSAGCSTIPGTSENDTPAGTWADFRVALGLDNAKPTKNDGKKFAYVLLTGRDARLVATGKEAQIPSRLRFGSNGADVRSLQDALAKHAKKYYADKTDGEFAAGTALAFIKYQKDRDAGKADGVVTPTDASALGFTLVTTPAGPVAKQLNVIVDFARGVFEKIYGAVTQRADEGRFVHTSDIAEIMHDDTPSMLQWTKKTANFSFNAYSPPSELKDLARLDIKTAKTFRFMFMLSFEYNGYDIRAAQVHRAIQGSTPLTDAKLEIKFVAKRATGVRAEVSRIDFLFNGKWIPRTGDKFVDFSGKVWVESDGDMGVEMNPTLLATLTPQKSGNFSNVKTTLLAPPKEDKCWHAIFFAVDKDVVTDEEMQKFKTWVRNIEKQYPVRWSRLREGLITVFIDGYASPTGKGQHNQDLSRKRKDKVKKFVQDEFGSGVKIVDSARGESNPGVDKKDEKEDAQQRRVDVYFKVPI
ncbi:MAG: papain-like cysteine protease family protein [Gemmatimonadota bacterium]